MTKFARADANQAEIVAAFRKLGGYVVHLYTIGKGVPDILVSAKGRTFLVEIKDGSKPPSARALTKDESRFHSEYPGELYIIDSVEQVIKLMGGL